MIAMPPCKCGSTGLLPSSTFQIVIDDIAAVFEVPGKKIFERTAPNCPRKPVFAQGRYHLVGIKACLFAGGQEMSVKGLSKPLAPLVAAQPFHQPLE